MLELHQCDHLDCGRKGTWFQPLGEVARCSCAGSPVSATCSCEHHALGCYQVRVVLNVQPPPPSDEPQLDVYTVALEVRATIRDTSASSPRPIALDATTVTCRRVVGLASSGNAQIVLDRDNSMLRMPTTPGSDGDWRAWSRHVDLRGDDRLDVEVAVAGVAIPITVSTQFRLS